MTDEAKAMAAERAVITGRVLFSEERGRHLWLRLVASGEVDEDMLTSLETFIAHQRKRMWAQAHAEERETIAA